MLDLYDPLMESYKPIQESKRNLNGYILDEDLSDINHKVYYNKDKDRNDRLLYTIRGSSNVKDFITDGFIPFGNLRDSKRYDESDNILKKAKNKYNEESAIIAGHSLGGSIAKAVAKPSDKVITYNSGRGLFGSNFNNRSNNIKEYRTYGDIVSLIPNKNTKTLRNKNYITRNFINSHSIKHLKNSGITI